MNQCNTNIKYCLIYVFNYLLNYESIIFLYLKYTYIETNIVAIL